MSKFWDDPDFKSGEFFQFHNDGDTLTGVYKGWDKKVWPVKEGETRSNVSLLLYIETGDGVSIEVTAPADLKKKWQATDPDIGDTVKIVQVGHNKTALGVQRFFSVEVSAKGPGVGVNPSSPGSVHPAEPPF